MNDLFYAANVYDTTSRPKHGLFEEQKLNKNAKYKIIGVSIETCPDSICKQELRRLRTYGVTRAQLGIQHTDDAILEHQQGHDSRSGVLAIKMLKANGFKVDAHVMPDLPGSDPDGDARMLETGHSASRLPGLHEDISVSGRRTHRDIRRWKESGTWKPYAETNYDKLVDVIVGAKSIVPKYIRLNRIQRDFPRKTRTHRVFFKDHPVQPASADTGRSERRGVRCACVRCREIKNNTYTGLPVYTVEHYEASGGHEYFISANTNEDRFLGFVRLRVNASNDENVYFNEIRNSGIIREAHVYGFLSSTTERRRTITSSTGASESVSS